MTDMQIRSDSVDVEQIMRQIRSRIRDKRGVDYTEDEIKDHFETVLDERKRHAGLVIVAKTRTDDMECRALSHRAESDGFSRSDLFQEP